MLNTPQSPGARGGPGGAWSRPGAGALRTAGAVMAVAGLVGCGGGSTGGTAGVGTVTPGASNTGTGAPLRLSGPDTGITVAIPTGWHQVIDSANPSVPEMVAPTGCAGHDEVSCAQGLARLADLTAPSAMAAAQTVQQAVDSGPGVKAVTTIAAGPHQVAGRPGYLLLSRFSNGSGTLTSEIAAVPGGTAGANPGGSGAPSPSKSGSRQFAVVLVWVSGKVGAPSSKIISQIIDSAALTDGP